MSDAIWVVLLAVVSMILLMISAAVIRNPYIKERSIQKVEEILQIRQGEAVITRVLRITAQFFFLYLELKRRTVVGRVDIASVTILAAALFFGWDKVLLKALEIYENYLQNQ